MSVITIDGPAGVGKGTLARNLASHYGFVYLDTGALYRATARCCLANGILPEAAAPVAASLTPGDLTHPDLRREVVGAMASRVAAIPDVRAALVEYQRRFAATPPNGAKGAVLDGRDTGTVICPEAPVKFFLTADPEIRAQRRLKELQERGEPAIYETILREIQERDVRDQTRAVAPLVPAADAVILDTSRKTIQDVFHEAALCINQRLDFKSAR